MEPAESEHVWVAHECMGNCPLSRILTVGLFVSLVPWLIAGWTCIGEGSRS
jgi:hypothetical protein